MTYFGTNGGKTFKAALLLAGLLWLASPVVAGAPGRAIQTNGIGSRPMRTIGKAFNDNSCLFLGISGNRIFTSGVADTGGSIYRQICSQAGSLMTGWSRMGWVSGLLVFRYSWI